MFGSCHSDGSEGLTAISISQFCCPLRFVCKLMACKVDSQNDQPQVVHKVQDIKVGAKTRMCFELGRNIPMLILYMEPFLLHGWIISPV